LHAHGRAGVVGTSSEPGKAIGNDELHLKPLHDLKESLPLDGEKPIHRTQPAQFRVSGGLMEIESPESKYRNVVVFDRASEIF